MRKKLALFLLASFLPICSACSPDSSYLSAPEVENNEAITTESILKAAEGRKSTVELGDYRNMDIQVERSAYEVTDDSIRQYMEDDLQYYETYTESAKEVAEDGDTVNLDYEGTMDGEAFDGGSAEGKFLELGSGSFIDGFEEQVVGHKKGESFDIAVTFPDDYFYEDYAGKPAVFHVTLNYIADVHTPEISSLTDEFVNENMKEVNGSTTVSEYEAYIKSLAESASEYQFNSDLSEMILEQMEKEAQLDISEEDVTALVETYLNIAKQSAEEHGMAYEEYVRQNFGFEDTGAYEQDLENRCREELTESLLLDAAIRDYGLTVTVGDFKDFVDAYASSCQIAADEVMEYNGGEDMALLHFAESQMMDVLVSLY